MRYSERSTISANATLAVGKRIIGGSSYSSYQFKRINFYRASIVYLLVNPQS